MAKKKSAKKKAKKDAAPAPAEGLDTAGMSREELEGKILRMKDEMDKEREERNYFQLERDKINTFWEITKRQLEQARAEIRNQDRAMEELEERHAVEIKVYKQKVKHLLYEHENKITELKTDAVMEKSVVEDEYKQGSDVLRRDKRGLKVELKERELDNQEAVKQMQLEFYKRVTDLYEQMELQAKQTRVKYEQQMDALREDMDLQRKVQLHEVEERKNQQLTTLLRNHEKSFGDIKNYYNDITLNNLALINSLKEQVEGMKQREERTEKKMAEVLAENRKLVEPLKDAKTRVAELEKQVAAHDRDKQFLRGAKAQIKVLEDQIKQLEWEQEVLQQRFQEVEAERDDLYERFVKTIYDVQQKSGFKNLILEKKLESLGSQLEKKEAQMNEVLAASNLDPTSLAVVTRKLEDVLDAKNSAIKELQYEVARIAKAHNDTVRTFESKLGEFGIPAAEVGFKLITLDDRQQLGQGPADLMA
jgi:chromosome segregation ATPase